jgi:hypothetical protein
VLFCNSFDFLHFVRSFVGFVVLQNFFVCILRFHDISFEHYRNS